MFMSISKIMVLVPFFVLTMSIVSIICSIIIKRNHFFVFFLTFFSIVLIFILLLFLNYVNPIYVSNLLCFDFYSMKYIDMIIFSSLCMIFISYFYLKDLFLYREEFYILILSSIMGSMLLTIAHHMFSVFIGLELMSLPIYGLMMYSMQKKKIVGVVLKYFIQSSIITILMLFGITLIYLMCGSLGFDVIKISLLVNSKRDNIVLLIGLFFVLTAFFFKLSLFPLHFWISDIYINVSPVVLLYSTTVIKIAVFSALMNLFMYFPYEKSQILYFIMESISVSSIIFGSIMSVFQKNILNFLGYASVVHMGYLATTLFMIHDSYISHKLSVIYFINYIISNIGIFSILNILHYLYLIQINKISFYSNIFFENPVFGISIIIILFSFLGIPFTFGFITKFLIIMISICKGYFLLNFSILFNSGLGIYYYLKVLINIYIKRNHNNNFLHGIISYKFIKIFVLFFSIMILIFGIFPNLILNIV
ncbi:NADH-quinone oxidoreductase subunit N [Buchnera aphidicola]|uniref:NADH-quinone oxidoreductase subunit N n=1 Tax=Buchnera aphidicola TaxID=9 RepID=UPI003464739A